MDIPVSVRSFIIRALEEDSGCGDITTTLLIPEGQTSTALIVAKDSFIVAGLPFAEEVFRAADPAVRFETLAEEGSRAKKSAVLARVAGKTRTLLLCERVALNVLQRLSGIATLTNAFVRKVRGTGAKILDTRKTTPGMRFMEKYAVRAGGGRNHRFGLSDGILIKDNHIEAVGSVKKAVELAREGRHLSRIEVEAETLKEFKEALQSGADVIMLDNMSVKDIGEAVRLSGGRALIEVSGGVSLENAREIAETGVDFISVGALTHSAPAVDISMKLVSGP